VGGTIDVVVGVLGAINVVVGALGAIDVVVDGRSREHEKPEIKNTPIIPRIARIGRKCDCVLHVAQRIAFFKGSS
jgi:hypothetical protein